MGIHAIALLHYLRKRPMLDPCLNCSRNLGHGRRCENAVILAVNIMLRTVPTLTWPATYRAPRFRVYPRDAGYDGCNLLTSYWLCSQIRRWILPNQSRVCEAQVFRPCTYFAHSVPRSALSGPCIGIEGCSSLSSWTRCLDIQEVNVFSFPIGRSYCVCLISDIGPRHSG